MSISFFRFSSPASRLWAFTQMGLARLSLPKTPEIGFWKLFGSGTGEGFTPIPNTAVYAILATWPSLDSAKEQTQNSRTYASYGKVATEHWTIFLEPNSVRGHWDGESPFLPSPSKLDGPFAALTRATVKPRIASQFWSRVPEISEVIGDDPNVIFKIGVGEVPLFQQVTFSIWPDTQSMAQFARKGGPHAKAIEAVRAGQWFKEELYARFRILASEGSWNGADPLNLTSTAEVA